jgi:hypothetical protein
VSDKTSIAEFWQSFEANVSTPVLQDAQRTSMTAMRAHFYAGVMAALELLTTVDPAQLQAEANAFMSEIAEATDAAAEEGRGTIQ